MKRKKSRLRIEQEKAEYTIRKTNEKIEELGHYTGELYSVLEEIQNQFDRIKGVPSGEGIEYKRIKAIRISWKQQVEVIDNEYKIAVAKNTGKGVAGAGAGVAVAAMGPSAAMGVATTFGVASTGTAISSLSGAAATNAALAWLGGGALASGGGGMAAGGAFLALAGPIGVAIAGVALLGSSIVLLITAKEKKILEDIYVAISKRDIKSYELAIVELNERIDRIKAETILLKDAINNIDKMGYNYEKLTEGEQYELGSYVNLMRSSTQLLVNPILGLIPKYTDNDFEIFITDSKRKYQKYKYLKYKDQIITLANLLYRIKLNKKEKQLLHKSLKDNKEMRYALTLPKKEFRYYILDMTFEALWYKDQIEKVV